MIDHVLDVVRVHKVSHAELACHFLTARVNVDTNDFVGTHHFGALNHVQADTAQTEHHHVGARFHFSGKQHGTHTSGNTATNVANLVERRIVANFRQRNFRRHNVVGEGGCAHVVMNRLAVEAETRGAVGH